MQNPAHVQAAPLPPMTRPPVAPSGLKTGQLELSKDQLADLMNTMLKDIQAPAPVGAGGERALNNAQGPTTGAVDGGRGGGGGGVTLESALAKVELRKKLPSFLRDRDR